MRDELIGLVRAVRAAVEFEGENFAHGVLPITGDEQAGPPPAAVFAPPPAPVPSKARPAKKFPVGGALSLFGEDDGGRAAQKAAAAEVGQVKAAELPKWEGPKLTEAEASEKLKALQEEIGPGCARCPLAKQGRSRVVFGVGKPNADLVFVGEGPGEDEDRQGEPFVGRAGQLLTKMIEAMGLARKDVYICNVVKCRPPGNRDPAPAEMRSCGPFMIRQLEIIRPKVIVALGKISAMYLKGLEDIPKEKFPISKYRGNFERYHGADLMLTFHPSYLLRTASAKKDAWADLQAVMKKLGLPTGKER